MSDLYFYAGVTLVDVTPTGVTRTNGLHRDQQRNWETVLQCIGIKTQPLQVSAPSAVDVENISTFKFGDFYTGPQRVWYWTWAVEPADIYDLPNQPLASLQKDFEQVPIITGLEETARFMLPIFYPYGTIKNIYFERITAA